VGSTSSGGEFGLNLFINDMKTIQVVVLRRCPKHPCPKHPLRKSWNAFTIFLSGVQFPGLNSRQHLITLRRCAFIEA
jgi:hypothetical protein